MRLFKLGVADVADVSATADAGAALIGNTPVRAQIAIHGNTIAIFGSEFGFAGPVLQDYTPFYTDEATAIAAAKQKLTDRGILFDDAVTRPRLTRVRIS